MGVRGFYTFIKQQGFFKDVELKNTEIVIGMQNLSCRIIKLCFSTHKDCGPMYDEFEYELKKIFEAFHRNNVNCYAVFMGCRENTDKTEKNAITKHEDDIINQIEAIQSLEWHSLDKPPPLVYREVAKSVLRDLGINYVTTAYEHHTDIKHIAKKLNCPILTYDSSFSHSGVPYLDLSTLKLDPVVTCKQFHLLDLLSEYNLSIESYIYFYAIFQDNFYDNDFEFTFNQASNILFKLGMPHRIGDKAEIFSSMLTWIAKQKSNEMIIEKLKLATRPKCFDKILTAIKEANEILYNFDDVLTRNPSYIAVVNGTFDRDIQFAEKDPHWLVKAVCIGKVPALFVNLCKEFKVFFGSNQFEDFDQEDSFIPSLPILRYSFDLLNNFKEKSFKLMSRTGNEAKAIEITSKYSIPKPKYDVNLENGGPVLLEYFAHFIQNVLPELDLCYVYTIPEHLQMIVVGMAYYQMKINSDSIMLPSLMLCHIFISSKKRITLGIGKEVTSGQSCSSERCMHQETISSNNDTSVENEVTFERMLLTDKNEMNFNQVPDEDCIRTFECISRHNRSGKSVDVKILHKIVQFQHCLQQLNFLNTLCGQTLAETKYEKFFNCPVWYNIYENLSKREDALNHCRKLWNESSKIRSYFDALNEIFRKSLKEA